MVTKWILNVVIALLLGVNVLSWGYCVRDLGNPVLSWSFLLKLVFNKFYILALGSALGASLLKYGLVHSMGVLKTGYFLMTSTVVSVLVAYIFLGERLTLLDWIGVGLIIAGVFILGAQR